MLVAYMIGVYRVQRSSRSWNGCRTACFLFGVAILVVALSPPLMDFAHRDLRGHMVQHLLIGMLAPLALVMSAPLLLAFRALPHRNSRSIAGAGPGPQRGMTTRLIALFLGIAAHAYLSKLMYIYLWPQHTPHSAGEIRAAAQIMYYGGDLAEGLLAVVLFADWYRKRGRRQARMATGTQRSPINLNGYRSQPAR